MMRVTQRNAALKIVPALLVPVLLAGCGGSDGAEGADGESGSGATHRNIGTLKIAALSNLYAAEELGYFDDHGLDVEFTQMGGGAELLPAVSAGQIDIALSIPSAAVQARDNGFDFRMVMQNEVAADEGADSQAVFAKADSGIGSVADLAGKRVAVNNIGSQMWLSLVKVLEGAGVDPEDVEFVEAPFPNMSDALANDQVDAVFNVEPFTSAMAASGDFDVVSYAATEALPGQPVGAFWTTGDWYEKNQAAAEGFVAAVKEATDYLAAHEDEKNEFIAEYTGIDESVIEKMTPIRWNSDVDVDTLQGLLDLMQENGLLKKPVSTDDVLLPTATS